MTVWNDRVEVHRLVFSRDIRQLRVESTVGTIEVHHCRCVGWVWASSAVVHEGLSVDCHVEVLCDPDVQVGRSPNPRAEINAHRPIADWP